MSAHVLHGSDFFHQIHLPFQAELSEALHTGVARVAVAAKVVFAVALLWIVLAAVPLGSGWLGDQILNVNAPVMTIDDVPFPVVE